MSAPHGPGHAPVPPPAPAPPPQPGQQPPNPYPNPYNMGPAPGSLGPNNIWGNGPVTTWKPGSEARVGFAPIRGHAVGPTTSENRAQIKQEKVRDQTRQAGHEYITGVPAATWVEDLGRIAFRGRRLEGQPVGPVARIAAGVGAVALSPLGLVGAGLRLPFRAAVNRNRGHAQLTKRVVPRRGEAPHAMRSGYHNNAYAIGQQQPPRANQQPPKPAKQPSARKAAKQAAKQAQQTRKSYQVNRP